MASVQSINDESVAAVAMRGRTVKVAHLHSTLGVYGAERWTLALLKHLDHEKIPTVVISVGIKPGADTFYRLLKEEGYAAFHLSVGGKLNLRMIAQLRSLLLAQQVDILHTHGFKADFLGYFSTRGLPIKCVSTIHGWSATEGRLIKFYEALSRLVLRRHDRVYPLSPALYDYLVKSGFSPSRLKMILNGVDLSSVNYNPRPRKAEDPFSILFAGRLCKPKGIYELLEGFASARFTGPASLTLIGDGPDLAELKKRAEDLHIASRIHFAGAVPVVAAWFGQADAIVLPSYAEGIPRVLMEAFAAGVPVIGTSIPGIQQLVNHGETGLLVPVADPVALATTLENLCASPETYRSLVPKARALVEEKFSALRMARDFEAEYLALS